MARKYETCRCRISRFQEDFLTGDVELSLSIPKNEAYKAKFMAQEAYGKDLNMTLADYKKKRSTDANAYCWVLCGKIAEVMPEKSPRDVYRENVRKVGVYLQMNMWENAVPTFEEKWESKGIGWFVDLVDDDSQPGFKLIHAFYGSSTYDTAEMSRLIDSVIQDAQAVGINTMTPKEIERLKACWRAA